MSDGGAAAGARTGIGYDCHRFSERRRLVLGGIEFDHPRGLEGHSDADVLTHAIIDALLGAAGLEDIGQHFPDTDDRYKDADSIGLLRETAAMLAERGFLIEHVDATLVIERPAISPQRGAMRQRLGEALGLSAAAVNLKATRGEGMGFVGRQEGIAALAVATISPTT
jgi:2-C-methyl-D-erythritol 2,4-cyclodiphosphate synthase